MKQLKNPPAPKKLVLAIKKLQQCVLAIPNFFTASEALHVMIVQRFVPVESACSNFLADNAKTYP
ncbi:MAG: hypothetical protein FJ398_24250 [Verrucomicrobia bacterium]|nr:hypothetical protein [Verrucomicrobiota bacterium]